jgi:hypothetical protein
MTDFTPGPWFVGAQNDALYVIDRAPALSNDYPNHDIERECIAKLYPVARFAIAANARLIAQAPALYEALEEAEQWLATIGSEQMPAGRLLLIGDHMNKARAVLAAARGEQ